MISYSVLRTLCNGKEGKNFNLVRPNGTNDYLLLLFKTPVIFTLFDKIHNISPGTCILLAPGTPHSFRPDNCELLHDWMHFLPSDFNQFNAMKIDINTFFTPINSDLISTTVKKCEIELISKQEFYEELVSSEVSRMFIKLKRQLASPLSGYHTDAFNKLRLDIYRNPSKYLNTTDMAKAVNLSRSRFSVIYKKLYNTTPQKDHINAKISKASYLLSVGTLSLTEISEMCGYENIYHFIRQFREIIGITPGKYKVHGQQ